MPLEKFFSGENINIKDLTIETPERQEEGLPFDPEKEMTEKERETMLTRIKDYMASMSRFEGEMSCEAARDFIDAKILFPEESSRLVKDRWVDMFTMRRDFELGQGIAETSFLEALAAAKLFFPEDKKGAKIAEQSMLLGDIARRLLSDANDLSDARTYAYLREVLALNILCPRERGTADDQKAGENVKRILTETIRRFKTMPREQVPWGYWLETAALVRLTFGGRASEFEIDKKVWDAFRDQFSHSRKFDRFGGFSDATSMKVLAAEEAYIDDNGMIVVNMRKKQKPELEPETPPMPEKRNF